MVVATLSNTGYHQRPPVPFGKLLLSSYFTSYRVCVCVCTRQLRLFNLMPMGQRGNNVNWVRCLDPSVLGANPCVHVRHVGV